MRVVRLTKKHDLESLFRFRHETYVERLGWLHSDASGLLIDEFDASAENYAAFSEQGDVVGSARVVMDGALGLPLEHCQPLDGYRDGKDANGYREGQPHPWSHQ